MKNLIESIVDKDFDTARELLEESIDIIVDQKLVEMKKMIMAKEQRQAWTGMPGSRQEKLYRGIIEEDDLDEMDLSREKPDYDAIDDRRKGQIVQDAGKTSLPGTQNVNDAGKSDIKTTIINKSMKEQVVNRDTKSSSPAYKSAQTRYTNRTITGKNTDGAIASSLARDDMTPQERMKSNETQQINTQLKTPAPKAGGYTDARTNKPYVAPKAEQMPLRGPTTQGSSQVNTAGKSDRVVRPSPTSTAGNTTTVKKVTYEETEEQLDEARINIVKARVRGGKVQRRKKVSNVSGMTFRGGKLTRMSPAERRRRKLGQRKGKMKRRAKMARALMKRKRSLQRRKSLGLG